MQIIRMRFSCRRFITLGHALAVVLLALPPLAAQLTNPLPAPLPSGIRIAVEPWLTIPASSGSAPRARINHIKPCPDGVRLFCNDLNGKLWRIASKDATSAGEFLDLAAHFPRFIKSPGLGTGFASFAFHPEFATAGAPGYGKFYTAHSESAGGGPTDYAGPVSAATSQVGVIVEWTMTSPGDTAIVTSPANFTRRTLLRIGFPYDYHDVQEIAFNPNATPGHEDYGCLFICIGDGGSIVKDSPDNLSRIDSVLGAIHRIAPILATGHDPADFTLSTNGLYHIPSGETNANPYVDAADPTPGDGFPVVREIYANGFRNPHRISWDSGGSGKMFCGNIGESQIEEVELVLKGRNYGWPHREGSFAFTYTDKTRVYPLPSPDTGGYTYPVVQFDHSTGLAVVGGFVYRGAAIPELQGHYLFGDIVGGRLFVAREADMNLLENPATSQAPAQPTILGLKIGTTSTTFRSILGTSRADLRFGIDHDGEPYLLSKQNGAIYRVKKDDSPAANPPAGGAGDWAKIADFENGSTAGIATDPPVSSSIRIVNDPREGPANRVLRLQAHGTVKHLVAHVPIPEIPDNSYGTLFFRFLVNDQDHNINFGLTDLANPSGSGNFADFEMQMRSFRKNGKLQARSAGAFVDGANISTGTWYSVWSQIHNAPGAAGDTWNLYIQGGAFSAPTLIRSDIAFRNGTTASLKRFLWILSAITATGDAHNGADIYFDDIHVDAGHANITDPTRSDWEVVDRFDGPDPLASWQIPAAAAQSVTLVTEPDGNRYLHRTASSSAAFNPKAIAARRLPFDTQVSQTVTTFFRMKLEGAALDHSLGISALNPADPATYTEDDFEPQIRLAPGGSLEAFDGPAGENGFLPAASGGSPLSPLLPDVWYKVWLVSSNAGFASGGQTWQAYLKGGPFHEPTPVTDTLFFRRGAEAPITHFLALASGGSEAGNDALCIDDIHAARGINLSDPVGAVPVPTTLTRSGDDITLSFPTTPNRAFQTFESADLQDWTPLFEALEGDASIWEIDRVITPPRRFFRTVEHSRRSFHAAAWSTDFPDSTLPRGMELVRANSSVTWTLAPGQLALANSASSSVAGMVGRPGGYVLAPGDWRNVTLTVEGRSLAAESTINRDICLVFGHVDDTRFYYAHLSRNSDGTFHTVIMKVNGNLPAHRGTIHVPIATGSTAGPLVSSTTNPIWHTLRITHSATGEIAAYVDNMSTPVLTAHDTTFPVGRVGFGTFDDPAQFRSVTVSGEQP